MQTHKYTCTCIPPFSFGKLVISVFVQRASFTKILTENSASILPYCWAHRILPVNSADHLSRKYMEVSPCPPPQWTPAILAGAAPGASKGSSYRGCFTQYFFSPNTPSDKIRWKPAKRRMCLHTNICMSTQIIVFEFLFYIMLLCGVSGFCYRGGDCQVLVLFSYRYQSGLFLLAYIPTSVFTQDCPFLGPYQGIALLELACKISGQQPARA